MSKSKDPDVIALDQDEEWLYHVVEFILLYPCPDGKGWTCVFSRMRSDLTFTRGMKNKLIQVICRKGRLPGQMLVSIGCGFGSP